MVLYCDKYYDLEGQTYHVENLPGVWHKFAFVCVPDISQGMGSGMFPAQNTFLTYKDLYDFAIDYRPVENAEQFASEILKQPNPLDPVAQTFQGGPFVTMDYTAPEKPRG